MARRTRPGPADLLSPEALHSAIVRGVNLPALGGPASHAPGPICRFFVEGEATPWRAPTVTRGGNAYSPAHVRAWQRAVAVHARLAMGGRPPHEGPVLLRLRFARRPVKGSPDGSWWAARPDLTNLQKCLEDALAGVCFADDRQVVRVEVEKRRGLPEGVDVEVWALP